MMNSRKSILPAGAIMLAVIVSSCNIGAKPTAAQDPGAVQTQAFNMVMTQSALQQTQTSMAVPPTAFPTNTLLPTNTLTGFATFAPVGGTSTPFGFNTQQPGFTPLALLSPIPTVGSLSTLTTKNGCNDGEYLGEDPFYTDSSHFLEVRIGDVIEQYFHYKNTGTCAWDEGYAFLFQTAMSSPEIEPFNIILQKNRPADYTAPGNEIRYKAIIKAPKLAGDYKAFWKLRDDKGNLFGPLVSLYIRVRKP
jgi:hypothetical protein